MMQVLGIEAGNFSVSSEKVFFSTTICATFAAQEENNYYSNYIAIDSSGYIHYLKYK